jgi:autotransporter-associated beta strand protein
MVETIGTSVNESYYTTWIATDTRRNNFFWQLTQQGLWPNTLAPDLSHYGGVANEGLQVTISNPNGSGTIYFTTDGTDPRAPGGFVAGQTYSDPIPVNESTLVRARVLSAAGDWSPEIAAHFIIPPPSPTFLPAGSGDWTLNDNWSSAPLAYPNSVGGVAVIPPGNGTDRNVNLRAPVTIGVISFPQNASTNRNRVRDQDTGSTLTFQNTNGPALIEVGGTAEGYVEFEVLAGASLQSDLRLHITNIAGNAEYGALRLRANWSGPGGLIKSGLGVASLTGDAKTYTGATLIEEGVLLVSQPATPTASFGITVRPGGQLRLISANDAGGPRVYAFGGPLFLEGYGRGPEIPEHQVLGKLGALRYDPGSQDNKAVVANPVELTGPTDLHVDGARNVLELAGVISGPHPITKSGGGTLRLAADNSAFTQSIQIDNGTLELAGPIGSPVNLADTGKLSGHGRVGWITGSGSLVLKQSILYSEAVANWSHSFVLGKTGSPLYAQSAAAGNGLLLLPALPTPPLAMDIYLTALPVSGDVFRGGYFVPFGLDLAGALAFVPKRVFVPDVQGGQLFDNQTWSEIPNVQFTTVAEAADFGQGLVQGRALEVRVDGAPVTFAAWQAAAFPSPADLANPLVSGPGANPNGSGVPNLLRYALGLSLTDNPAPRAPQFAGSASAPAIRFPFDAGCNDIAYVVEATGDVFDWSSPRILFDSRMDFPPTANAGWISVSDPAASGQQQYYRLRVFLIGGP